LVPDLIKAVNKVKILPEPEVVLVNWFENPYNNVVATARTCYSPKVVLPEDVSRDAKSSSIRDRVFESIYKAGHHTTLQHPQFQFILKNISRHFVWSFLHSHPFYNSEQVSQRYVQVLPENFLVPPLENKERQIYISTISKMMDGYSRLQKLIYEDTKREYSNRISCHSRAASSTMEDAIGKKVLEIARYALPVATHTFLYHTINGLTLYRYYKLSNEINVPCETRTVVAKMVEEVLKIDPLFMKNIDDPIPLEDTLEYKMFDALYQSSSPPSFSFIKEFDLGLEGHKSKLIDYPTLGEKSMADAVRCVLGASQDEMPDFKAIDIIINPAINDYLSNTLTVTTLSKLSSSMHHIHFVFKKKLSHTADSQNQRHRLTPASRPIIIMPFVWEKPDYIMPAIIAKNPSAREYFSKLMEEVWEGINMLHQKRVKEEFIQYLLPNAFPIRIIESGDLLNYHHKWVTRLCYLAQEEIWSISLDEVKQIKKLFPSIGKYIRAPCGIRKLAGDKKLPYCQEGKRFCGVKVWDLEIEGYQRDI